MYIRTERIDGGCGREGGGARARETAAAAPATLKVLRRWLRMNVLKNGWMVGWLVAG